MSTYSYYRNYSLLSLRKTELESALRGGRAYDEAALYEELRRTELAMDEIEKQLSLYVPFDLPPRIHFHALEEREFLFYRCIKGLTMMKTAELLGVSRDTVYRIKRRLVSLDGTGYTYPDD